MKRRITSLLLSFIIGLSTTACTKTGGTNASQIRQQIELQRQQEEAASYLESSPERVSAKDVKEQLKEQVGYTTQQLAQDVTEFAGQEPQGSPAGRTGLTVTYFDVGQGDSIYLNCDGYAMLIDAGVSEAGGKIKDYLERDGVDTLSLVISTHPDADHIGGMYEIIKNFNIGLFIQCPVEGTTATYDYMKQDLHDYNINTVTAIPGTTYALGTAQVEILAPMYSTYSDINNESVVCRVVYGDKRFIFMGDAETEEENDLIHSGYDLQADVIKLGHHGSSSSSSRELISAVNPKAAVISCGYQNEYGHPHSETLNTIRAAGIECYRTDEDGTLICTTDGKTLTWNVPPSNSWKSGSSTW